MTKKKDGPKVDAELEHAWEILTDVAVFHSRSSSLLQTFLSSDSAASSEWEWEAYLAQVFGLPLHHPAVDRLAAKVRAQEKPYRRINYSTPAKTREFIGRLEQHAYPAFQGPS